MAKKFFSSNYGSPLMRVDNSGIQQAGQAYGQAAKAQGQMLANIGSQIEGVIKQYGLNKEKRQREEDTAIGNLANFSPEDLLALETTNPKLAQAIQRATTDQATPRDFQTINAGTAPFIAAQGRERDARLQDATIVGKEFENKFNEADKTNRLLRSTIETEGAELLNKFRKQQNLISEIEADIKSNERDIDRDKRYLDLDKAKLELDDMRETIKTKRNKNSVFAEQLERERTKDAVDISVLTSQLAVNAEKLDQLRASRDVDLKTKEENLLTLETERKQLQQDLTNRQNLMSSLSSDVTDDSLDFIQPIDIDDSFQGGPLFGKDAAGLFYNIVGGLGSAFGADITPETTGQAQNLLMLETFLLPALASDISSRPSNFTLEVARQKIPLPSDRDDVGQRKIEQLIPDLKLRLVEAKNTLKSGKTDATYFQEARLQASRIGKIIPILENSLKEKNTSFNAGRTLNNVGFKVLNRGQR